MVLALCLSMCIIPAAAAGNGVISELKVSIPSESQDGSVDSVNWFLSLKDSKYYLFLPASYDKSDLTVEFTATDAVYCGDTELVSGNATDVFASGSATLTCGGTQYNVVLLDGGVTGAVFINTESGSLDAVHADKEYKEPGTISVLDENGESLYNGALDYIKGRGNSTWNNAKKPYNIKLNKKADLFGMGKAKKWCLLANAGDATLLKNQLAYSFAKSIGVDITSDVIPVGLYVNGNYMGAYSVTEKVEIGENRIDITDLEKMTEDVNEKELNRYPLGGDQRTSQKGTYQYVKIPNDPENITGGYLLELEKVYRYVNEDSGFITNRGQAVVIKSPEESTQSEVEYMRAYYQEFEDALYSYSGYNSQGKHYTDYLYAESIARMYIAEEFGENFDGCSSSFFLYKDVDGIITAGPAWDFDLAFSTNSRLNTLINRTTTLGDPQSLYIQHCFIDNYDESHKSFLAQLFTHEDFQQTVQNVWNNVVKQIYPAFDASIQNQTNIVSNQAVMNAIRWNTYGTTNTSSIRNSIQNSVNNIRGFITARYSFLSTAYAENTYFVKYDTGEDGKALVFDTKIYNEGEQAAVICDPVSKDNEKHFLYWTTTPDGSGTHYHAGDTVTVNGNVNFYAQWENHTLAAMPDGTETCTLCGVTYLNGSLISDGWYADSYFKKHVRLTGVQNLPSEDGSNTYWYRFDDDGQLIGLLSGIYNGYYYKDGAVQKGAGVIKIDRSYYYIGQQGQIYKNGTIYLKAEMTNGYFPAGNYSFDSEGKIILKQGVVDGYYYIDGVLKKGVGVVQSNGGYYFIGQQGQVVKSQGFVITEAKTNGLIPAGKYNFDSEGKIIL